MLYSFHFTLGGATSKREKNKMGDDKDRTLWCGNLNGDITEELLYELFVQVSLLHFTVESNVSPKMRCYMKLFSAKD